MVGAAPQTGRVRDNIRGFIRQVPVLGVARALKFQPVAGGMYEHRPRLKEADVDERSRVLMATFLGAVVGGVWGWLYMTDAGRRVRNQIEPKLDDFMNELTRMRGTVEKARSAANEGWRSLSDITGGGQGRWSA
jgi:hypothetical protein